MGMAESNDLKTDLPSNFLLPLDYRKAKFLYIYYTLGRLSFIETFLKVQVCKTSRLGAQYNFTVIVKS